MYTVMPYCSIHKLLERYLYGIYVVYIHRCMYITKPRKQERQGRMEELDLGLMESLKALSTPMSQK